MLSIRSSCSSSMNTASSPGLAEIHQVVKKVALLILRLIGGRQIGQGGLQQGAADAVADGVDLALAGGLLDGVQRRQRPSSR
jgi:hypothetical protein